MAGMDMLLVTSLVHTPLIQGIGRLWEERMIKSCIALERRPTPSHSVRWGFAIHSLTTKHLLEAMLKNDPFVKDSMMFGRGRFHTGILVQPKAEFEFDPADMSKVADFRNLIW